LNIGVWIRELRAPFFTCTLVPVVLGTSVALYDSGVFDLVNFLLVLAGTVSIHAGANMIDDYFDYRSGCDLHPIYDELKSPFFGGSRILTDGKLSPRSVYLASMLSFTVGAVIGIYFVFLLGWPILALGVTGLFFGYFHVNYVCKWGLAEFSLFLNFGPLITVGSYYVQTGHMTLMPWVASIPVGLIMACMLLINQVPDREADARSNKNTIAVRYGEKTAVDVFSGLFIAAYLFVVVSVLLGFMPPYALLALITLPLALRTIIIAEGSYDEPSEITLANKYTYQNHFFTGILLTVGYLIPTILSNL